MSQELGDFESYKDAVIDLYGAVLYDVLDDPAEYHSIISRLPDKVPEITAANMLILEVKNGGFHQYFYNSYGITIKEAISGLELSQQDEYAKLAREAAGRFGASVPESREERVRLIGEFGDKGPIRFGDLDERFYAVPPEVAEEYWDRFEKLSAQLLRDNPN